jgi:FtsP/CotA-like multicopper oxidase with cupredoxin domain
MIDSGSGSQLLFYHPHFDGSQALQLFGGMLGAFVEVHPAHKALFAKWDTLLLLLHAIDLDNTQKGSLMDNQEQSPGRLENPLKLAGVMLLSNEQLAPRMPLKSVTPARLRLANAIVGIPNMLCVALQSGLDFPANPAAQSSSAATHEPTTTGAEEKEAVNTGGGGIWGEGGGGRTEARDAEDLPGCTMDVFALDGIFLDEPRRQESVLIYRPGAGSSSPCAMQSSMGPLSSSLPLIQE